MSKVIVPNLKFDPNEFELEGEIISEHQQKCLDGSIFEYYLVKTKYGINKYIKEEVKYENSFNEESDVWTEIEGIGRFKGLEIITEESDDIGQITINLTYDEWHKK